MTGKWLGMETPLLSTVTSGAIFGRGKIGPELWCPKQTGELTPCKGMCADGKETAVTRV